ncbi:MAG: SelB C-terminal domain-containing protein, partial [Planctomycetes bacterium]|nr:SelB C-terminal domain-containing protein [Planctomycetota bacterium]
PEGVPAVPRALADAARSLLAAYVAASLQPPYDHPAVAAQADPRKAERALTVLRERGWLLRINGLQHLHRDAAERLISGVRAALAAGQPVEVQWIKQAFGLTRKHAVPLLEWLDAIAVTRRVGDARVAGPRPELPVPLLGAAP